MKKLFLASFASVSLDLITELLSKPPTELKVAYIPTAGDLYQEKFFVEADKEKLLSMGFSVIRVDLKNKKIHELRSELQDIDLILVAGGNTFYLMDQIKKSGFDVLLPELLERGVIYIGSSAGSIICCPTLEGGKRFDDFTAAPDLANFDGMNLLHSVIIPHAQKEKYRDRITLAQTELKEMGYETLALTDDEAIIVNGEEVKKVSLIK